MSNPSWYEDPAAVKTTSGDIFTGDESRQLARLIYKRFGRNAGVAAAAWRRLLENNCSERQFMALVLGLKGAN